MLDPDRFWARVARGAPDECWEWQAYRHPYGYGRLTGNRIAHRVAYEFTHGSPIPAGLVVRHTCDNPPCCNPAHLLLGTHADNMRDRDSRGRTHRVVTPEMRNEIIALRAGGASRNEVAVRFGVSVTYVSRIAPHVCLKSTTHCIHGHPLADENLYTYPDGRSTCRTCKVEWQRRHLAKKAAA